MAIDTVIKVSGTIPANATTNSIVNIDVPEDGLIMCIGAAISAIGGLAAQEHRLSAELSFLSTSQIGVNDARGSIGGITLGFQAIGTSSSFKTSEQNSLCITDGIRVQAGERIHMHGFSSIAALTAVATFLIYMQTEGGARRARKRR